MMNYKNISQEYDEIYLQANLEERDPDEFDLNGVTWCSDWVYEDDVKYLLATPEREAASELLEALKAVEWSSTSREDFGHHDYSNVPCCPICGRLDWYEPYTHLNRGHKRTCQLKIAIARVTPPDMEDE